MRNFIGCICVLASLTAGMASVAGVARVAVLDFDSEPPDGVNSELTVGLADFLELALQKEDVPTLERRQIRLVLAERSLSSGGMLSIQTLSYAKLPLLNYFVRGSVASPKASEFSMTLSVIRADNATVKTTLTKTGEYPREWLPAIASLAKEVKGALGLTKHTSSERSEFESLTWLPEAALPFFKGLEYYARGDYPLAAGWFRTASAKDPRFDQARLWEARALRQFGFEDLAAYALAATRKDSSYTRSNASKPMLAVIAPNHVPAASRATFINALKESKKFDVFEPQAIGATAREMDLQLTGQMAAPLNERSVWLVVDSIVFVDMTGGELRALQSELLSGRLVRQATVVAQGSEERNFSRLAARFLDAPESGNTVRSPDLAVTNIGEPASGDLPEVVFGKVLRLARSHPDESRPWIALADFYREWSPRMMLLERAISTIEGNPQQPEASLWLTSALWRKRDMLRRAYFYEGAPKYQENPLTNDFALLLKMFPDSTEAQTLEEWTHQAGKYTYSMPKGKNMRHLNGAVYGSTGPQARPDPSAMVGSDKPPATVGESEWLANLRKNRQLGNNAKAWMQANWRVPSLSTEARTKVDRMNDELVQIARREDAQFKLFDEAARHGDTEHALALGQGLLHCMFRSQRLAVIERCGELIKTRRGCEARADFLLTQLECYKEDFNFDPVNGTPRTETVDFRFDVGNAERPGSWANTSPDLSFARVLDEITASGTACGNLELTARIFDAIRNNEALTLRVRLTAQFDLARTRYNQGQPFEAVELLQELLQRSDISLIPQARGTSWSSFALEEDAFELLKKIRLFADPEVDYSKCCGKRPQSPMPKPANLEEINEWFAELGRHIRGGVAADNRSIKEHLIERRAEALPAILYNLQHQEHVQQMLIFAGLLGTNAIETLPFVVYYVCAAGPAPNSVYGNALSTLSKMGKPAAGAMPVLILASEGSGYLFNVKAALANVGTAPPSSIPYLARLLYHKNPTIGEKAAKAMVETAKLSGEPFGAKSGEALTVAMRTWWETHGRTRNW